MLAADEVIDIGPEAGTLGGEVVAYGPMSEILKTNSLTAGYLNGTERIAVPEMRRQSKKQIVIKGARENNLKNIDVTFPLNMLTVVSGVSGSGKSSLVKRLLYPIMMKKLGGYGEKAGHFTELEGDFTGLKRVEFVDQNPIGRSSRSNPVTYINRHAPTRSVPLRTSMPRSRSMISA